MTRGAEERGQEGDMPVIDSDAHVVETERTWEFIPEEGQAHRPVHLVAKDKQAHDKEYWLVGDRVYANNINIGEDTPDASREASDIKARLSHMDELGVDVHVLYPTLFLTPLTTKPDVDVALCQGYNRWMASVWEQAPDRLRWPVVLPLLDMNKAIEELHYGVEHGGCGVFIRGVEAQHRLSDPHLFPLYEEASKLNVPICVHSATGNFTAFDLFTIDSGFRAFKLAVVGAVHDLLMKDVPARFPDLRWVVTEVSAQWIPYALNDLDLRLKKLNRPGVTRDILRDNRMYVACQTTDDFDRIFDYVDEEHILLGTDYGHNDTATELHGLRRLRESGAVDAATVDKILWDNPKIAYAL